MNKLGLTEQSTAKTTPGRKENTSDLTADAEDDLDEEGRAIYASAAGSLMYHSLDRPDMQFSTSKVMSAISAPKVKHMAQLKYVARYLVSRGECAWYFKYQEMPAEVLAYADADWASNGDSRRSVDCCHLMLGKNLIETSTSTQQVVALSSSESEFYGVLRSAACALQLRALMVELDLKLTVRVLSDSSGARGMIKRSGSGKVKHLETRYLWLQERHRRKELEIGVVDTSLNVSDLGTKFHPAWRQKQLMDMMPIKVGIGLMQVGTVTTAATDQEVTIFKESNDDSRHFYVYCGLIALAAFIGFLAGMALVTKLAKKAGRQEAQLEASAQKRREETKRKRDNEVEFLSYQVAKAKMLKRTVIELQRACGSVKFACGSGASKEAMVRGLMAEHGYDFNYLMPERAGLLCRSGSRPG